MHYMFIVYPVFSEPHICKPPYINLPPLTPSWLHPQRQHEHRPPHVVVRVYLARDEEAGLVGICIFTLYQTVFS